ncbi:MAG: zinc ABC transporter substrate-binding protein [Thermodesulfobacteriota bacterium]|nr:zinc ABC transporter substrate-binding protein [Thermodesulfobacteriota bacterium]
MIRQPLRLILRIFVLTTVVCIIATAGFAVEKPLPVFVSIPPQKYFVEQIGGDRVTVDVLLPAGKSPATFTPEPSRIKRLAAADIYFRIGVPFENMVMPMMKTIGGHIRVVDTRRNIPLRAMTEVHRHADDDHAEMDGKDPHVWMAPMLVKQQAFIIRDALCNADPRGCDVYRANTAIFVKTLADLHRQLEKVLQPVKGERLFVFHPAFGYFADAYGLEQVAVEMAGKAPKGRQLLAFIKQARGAGVRVIFVQSQFDRRAAQKIADAIGGAVVPLDPLDPDYMTNMTRMAETIRQALIKKNGGTGHGR